MKKKLMVLTAAALLISMSAPAYALSENDVNRVEMGSSRSEVHAVMGEGEVSSSGRKEVYRLEGGASAVAYYDSNTLIHGYIINAE